MPQLNLNFIDIPIPETCLWEQFDDEQKANRHRDSDTASRQTRPSQQPAGANSEGAKQ